MKASAIKEVLSKILLGFPTELKRLIAVKKFNLLNVNLMSKLVQSSKCDKNNQIRIYKITC